MASSAEFVGENDIRPGRAAWLVSWPVSASIPRYDATCQNIGHASTAAGLARKAHIPDAEQIAREADRIRSEHQQEKQEAGP